MRKLILLLVISGLASSLLGQNNPEKISTMLFNRDYLNFDFKSINQPATDLFPWDGYIQKLDSIVQRDYDELTGEEIGSGKTSYEYEDNLLVMDEFVIWNPDVLDWQNYLRSEYDYDFRGRLIREMFYMWDEVNEKWMASWKTEMAWDAYGMTSLVSYEWQNDIMRWIPSEKETFEYDPMTSRLIESTDWEWDMDLSIWIPFKKYVNVYFDNGDIYKEEVYQKNDFSGNWNLIWFWEYSYDQNGFLVVEKYVDVIGPTLFTAWIREFSYTPGGDILTSVYREWDDYTMDFQNVWKESYNYDRDRSIQSIVSSEWDDLNFAWEEDSKMELTYNKAFINEDLLLPFVLFGDDLERDLLFRYMIEQADYYEWSTRTSSWMREGLTTLHYSGLVSSDRDHLDPYFKIYPNPATGYIDVEFEDKANQGLSMSVCDSFGRNVISKVVHSGERVGMDGLIPGVYSLRMLVDGHWRSGQFILE